MNIQLFKDREQAPLLQSNCNLTLLPIFVLSAHHFSHHHGHSAQ